MSRIVRIPGFDDYFISEEGKVFSNKTKVLVLMKLFTRTGYTSVTLTQKGKYKVYSVHRLVALAFLWEPPTPKHFVLHLDDDRENPQLSNLRYGLPADNSKDMTSKGRQAKGESIGGAKLTEADVNDIRIRLARGERGLDLAKRYGVVPTNISAIKNYKTWKHL